MGTKDEGNLYLKGVWTALNRLYSVICELYKRKDSENEAFLSDKDAFRREVDEKVKRKNDLLSTLRRLFSRHICFLLERSEG